MDNDPTVVDLVCITHPYGVHGTYQQFRGLPRIHPYGVCRTFNCLFPYPEFPFTGDVSLHSGIYGIRFYGVFVEVQKKIPLQEAGYIDYLNVLGV
jgi:hypothetical protein